MITLWDSGDVMRASAQEADQLGERTADISDQKIANVAQYDADRGGPASLSSIEA
jgi:hypothetical protein